MVLFITILKGLGVKDPLSIRNISVILFSWRCIPDSTELSFILSMSIMGVLSSISKLLEYRAIGAELQIVIGTPIKFIFKYIRKWLLLCISEEKIEWIDPKFTIDISEKSRTDLQMDVFHNFYIVITDLMTGTEIKKNENEETESKLTFKDRIFKVLVFIIVVLWASVIEWVQPIAELFLYAHNWRLSPLNVCIVILSEFADFDKMLEVWIITKGLHENGDVIEAKVTATWFKPMFWALGYSVVMPLSLLWAYYFYNNHLKVDVDDIDLHVLNAGVEDNEMIPPLDRTTTPLLDDSYIHAHSNNDSLATGQDEDEWNRFKYKHQEIPPLELPPLDKGDVGTVSTAL